ncbi:ATP-binding cassette domain-containing protein [Boudabousia liubingyangii]|nr:ATP-binding cassette domain-containing protein [Boudabousia liubingyangii]
MFEYDFRRTGRALRSALPKRFSVLIFLIILSALSYVIRAKGLAAFGANPRLDTWPLYFGAAFLIIEALVDFLIRDQMLVFTNQYTQYLYQRLQSQHAKPGHGDHAEQLVYKFQNWQVSGIPETYISLLQGTIVGSLVLVSVIVFDPIIGILIATAIASRALLTKSTKPEETTLSSVEDLPPASLRTLILDPQNSASIRTDGVSSWLLQRYKNAHRKEIERLEKTEKRWRKRELKRFPIIFLPSIIIIAGIIFRHQDPNITSLALFELQALPAFQGIFVLPGGVLAACHVHNQCLDEMPIPVTQGSSNRKALKMGLEIRHISSPSEYLPSVWAEQLEYTYPGSNTPALKVTELEISGVSSIAIVGENGAGKSTLANLLAGTITPTKGKIQGLDNLQTTMLSQDFFKLPLTLIENITLNNEANTDPVLLEKAIIWADLKPLLATLPNGIKTCLNPGLSDLEAPQLSGGQWQRIALARTYYHARKNKADLIILDEPTSSLDAEIAAKFPEKISELTTPTIILTHRMNLATQCQHVIALHEGKIVEQGSPKDLLANPNGYVRTLHDTQARSYHVR